MDMNAVVISNDLTEAVRSTAVLVDLSLSMWSAERTDRSVGIKVKEDHNAVGNTGRYLKNLMAGCDSRLKDVRSAYQFARATHYNLTLPWVSDPTAQRAVGPRLLPNALFERYLTEMGKLQRAAHALRDEFIQEYPTLIQTAQANLGDMANPDEYPTPAEISAAFKLKFDFQPIPATNAFRGLSDAMLTKLGAALERRQQAAIQGAQGAMWSGSERVWRTSSTASPSRTRASRRHPSRACANSSTCCRGSTAPMIPAWSRSLRRSTRCLTGYPPRISATTRGCDRTW